MTRTVHLLAAGNSGGNAAAGFAIILVGLAAYFVPSIVALARRESANVGPVIVINLFLGWTVVGWIVALAMACTRRRQAMVYAPPPFPPGDRDRVG